MAVLGLRHTTLAVPNLEQAVGFYTQVLGFVVVQEISILDSLEMFQFTGLAD